MTKEPVPWKERLGLRYKSVAPGETWSDRLFDCAWAHVTGKIPAGENLALKFDPDGEGLVYDKEGNPVRGITNFCCGYDRSFGRTGKLYVPLEEFGCEEGEADFWIDVANNDPFGNFLSGTLKSCCIVQRNPEDVALYYDFGYLLNLADHAQEPQKSALLYLLERVGFTFSAEMTREDAARASVLLRQGFQKGGNPYLTLYAEGHSHLDLAWLWPIRETRRKAARTVATALNNLKRYPDYVYGISQPQQLEWLKSDYPTLFERVKEQVNEGRIELQGGMWVESDTNLPCGESLIRQIFYGKKFYAEEFSFVPRNLWLPDAFGFSASLPQIMRGCGLNYFLTIKLGWNETNPFPYHTFRWQGNDGSEVLAHIPPEEDYNSCAAPSSLLKAQNNYREKGLSDKAMLLYGIGDGGGGPGEEHLEFMKRHGDVFGLPKVENSRADRFFGLLEKDCADYPVYRGELYLERHQGTYTSQSRNKRNNRIIENGLCLYEAVACSAHTFSREKTEKLWKETLLYQFHDILPGSSIARVYEESTARYAVMQRELEELSNSAAETLGNEPCAFNSTSFERDEILVCREKRYRCKAAPFAFSRLIPQESERTVRRNGLRLENEYLAAEFSETGALKSLFSKTLGREMLEKETRFVLFADEGDAWDIYQRYYLSEGKSLDADSVLPADGVDSAGLRFTYAFGSSVLTVDCILKEGARRLEFEAVCNWQERGKMLRFEFFPAVSSETASFDSQYGYVVRSMRENNGFERAQFEVCGQKFVDVSEKKFGVSLFSREKYGYRVKNGAVSLNLLRSQNYPCVSQDAGEQIFSFALYPHAGDVESGEVYREAYCYHRPLKFFFAAPTRSPARTDNPRVVIDWVKPARYGDGVVLRVLNTSAGEESCSITTQGAVFETNMLEENERASDPTGLRFRPFEVKTFVLRERTK
ncbi:MAG: alpha-mannosidase [Candidatus Gallimonas sp.]